MEILLTIVVVQTHLVAVMTDSFLEFASKSEYVLANPVFPFLITMNIIIYYTFQQQSREVSGKEGILPGLRVFSGARKRNLYEKRDNSWELCNSWVCIIFQPDLYNIHPGPRFPRTRGSLFSLWPWSQLVYTTNHSSSSGKTDLPPFFSAK